LSYYKIINSNKLNIKVNTEQRVKSERTHLQTKCKPNWRHLSTLVSLTKPNLSIIRCNINTLFLKSTKRWICVNKAARTHARTHTHSSLTRRLCDNSLCLSWNYTLGWSFPPACPLVNFFFSSAQSQFYIKKRSRWSFVESCWGCAHHCSPAPLPSGLWKILTP
jgi:hypothetical protein